MSRPSILLVEDDENDIFFFQRAARLAEINHPIHVAHDGQAAIDFCSAADASGNRGHPLPGLIVLDLNLPYRSGFDVLEYLRRNPATRLTVVVVFTSSIAEIDVARAYALGANSYVTKRAKPEALVELLKLLKTYWFEANVLPPTGHPG